MKDLINFFNKKKRKSKILFKVYAFRMCVLCGITILVNIVVKQQPPLFSHLYILQPSFRFGGECE